MGFVGHAFVDWDDTIAENIRYFAETEEINCRLIARATGADPAEVRARGRELDLATARRMGLGKDSLPTAWLACYREFAARAGLPFNPETEAELVRACRIPYEIQQQILPGAAEVVAWLNARGFEVVIWTAGDHQVQARKVRDSGLSHLIHRVQIVPDKTPELLRNALGNRDPDRCFVVGNSIHSDIRPALAVGLLSIHVPAETWAYDDGEVDLEDPHYRKVSGIHEVPAVVADWFRLPRENQPTCD